MVDYYLRLPGEIIQMVKEYLPGVVYKQKVI
jgi:hypothetical protein